MPLDQIKSDFLNLASKLSKGTRKKAISSMLLASQNAGNVHWDTTKHFSREHLKGMEHGFIHHSTNLVF